jgi:hypothetical protein
VKYEELSEDAHILGSKGLLHPFGAFLNYLGRISFIIFRAKKEEGDHEENNMDVGNELGFVDYVLDKCSGPT